MQSPKRISFLLLLTFPILCLIQQGAASAQTPAVSPSQQPALVPRPAESPAPEPAAGGGRIKLDVVVTDKSGKPVSGLDLKDFGLFDNKLPGKILSFHAIEPATQKDETPAEVIIVIDTVNEPFNLVSNMRQQIADFLRQNGGHLAQPVSLYVLTDSGMQTQSEPTVDGNALATIVTGGQLLRSIGRSAGAWGAVERFQLSVQQFGGLANNESARPGRKLLIWAGGGWPLLDSANIDTSAKGQGVIFNSIVDLSNLLRSARISVYSISFGMPSGTTYLYEQFVKGVKNAERANPSNLGLKVFAIQSGGLVEGPNNDLKGQLNTIVQDAGAYYTISFNPPRADRANEYHDLKVVVDKPGLTARTDTGYYNQP